LQLAPGTKLGPYEITASVGAGGMGEVYRATDTRLGRAVAVKVLPSRFADREDVRQRFEREARAVSLLNHPHICTLYDVGDTTIGGERTQYLVMEFVEGETLAERLARGPLPIDQVIRIGTQIADALDRAHRSGITHRDLKPGNVMLTRSGGAKLLDFGLAKLSGGDVFSSEDKTVEAVTAEGHIIGTLQYMAPEQLEGKGIDARSDIFALGVMLYEMVTGRRAFEGTSQASLIASILRSQPQPVSQLQPVTPRALDRLIAGCMEKEPDDRWQSAHDVMLQLRAIGESSGVVEGPLAVRRSRRNATLWMITAAVVGAGLLFAGWRMLRARGTALPRKLYLSVVLPHPMPLEPNGFGAPFDISPDGTKIGWVARENGHDTLLVRAFDSPEVQTVVREDGLTIPFFSADGESIGVFSQSGRARVFSLRGRATMELGQIGPGAGATWLKDGSLVYVPFPSAPLYRVQPGGGDRELVLAPDTAGGEAGYSWPDALPDGMTVLFTVEREDKPWNEAQIVAYSLATKRKKTILTGGTRPRYVDSGHLLYMQSGKLMAVRFDPDKLETMGDGTVLLDDVISTPGTGSGFYAASRSGTLVWVSGDTDYFSSSISWIDPAGKAQKLPLPAKTYVHPRLSHGGSQLAVQIVGPNDDIWVYDFDRGTFTRVTSKSENLFPCWSPDDRSFVVGSIPSGKPFPQLTISRIDGSAPPRHLATTQRPQFPSSWSSDGRIVFSELTGPTQADISIVHDDGTQYTAFAHTQFNESNAVLSPDGKWIAYSTDESGEWQVYLRRADATGLKIQVSSEGGREPMWGRDGRSLYYRNGSDLLRLVVDLAGETPHLGKPALAYRGPLLAGEAAANYDVGKDGRLLVVERIPGTEAGDRLNILIGGLP
jgi:serine/threonine-protein kinase